MKIISDLQKQAHDSLKSWILNKNKIVKKFGIDFYEEVYISYNSLIDKLDKGVVAQKRKKNANSK